MVIMVTRPGGRNWLFIVSLRSRLLAAASGDKKDVCSPSAGNCFWRLNAHNCIHLIDIASLFRATVFWKSKHASHGLELCTTVLKRHSSLWCLISQVTLPPRLEDASVLKRCPRSAAAYHFALLFFALLFFERVRVNILGVSLVSSLVISFNLRVCVLVKHWQTVVGCVLCFLFFVFLNGTSRRNSGT